MKAKKNKKSKSKSNNKLINKKMSFENILKKKPEAAGVLMDSGMHCFGCSMASMETLEQGASAHGLDADKLVEKINKKK